MKRKALRTMLVPVGLALGFIVLDLAIDNLIGVPAPFNWPHFVFALVVLSVVVASMHRVLQERLEAEAAALRARDELDERVRERTAELRRTNEMLRAEIAERKRVEQALRSSQETTRVLVDTSPDYALLFDSDGTILAANEPVAERLGTTAPDLIGACVFDVFRADVVDVRRAMLERILRTGEAVRYEEESSRGWLDISISPIFDAEGRIARFATYAHDITEHRRMERALRESEERYRTLFDHFPEPVTVWDRDGVLLMQNLVSASNLGGERADYLGKTLYDIFGEAAKAYLERIQQVIDTGDFACQEDPVPLHGQMHYFWTCMQRVQDPDTAGYAAQVISYDITERKRLEELSRQAQLERARNAQERAAHEERQRLARELHDSVSQALYGIALGANTALKLFETDRAKALEALNYVLTLATAGLTEMRAVILELRPESLEAEGLVMALSNQAAALRARHSIEVELTLCEEPDVPFPIKEALYRIGQEAMHNAAKHARCSRVDVQLNSGPAALELVVVDNGVGFDAQTLYPGHLGLHSMYERAEGAGGTLDILSEPGLGTRVRASIPLTSLAQADTA